MTQNWPFGDFFSLTETYLRKKVLLSAVMLNMLNHVESPPPKMVLSAVMLNMLNVLGTIRTFFGGGGGG